MTGVKPMPAYQFALFRWLLGLYLATHFAWLLPWGPELFSRTGVFPDASASPLYGVFPNLLALVDQPFAVQAFLAVMTVAALAYAAGFARPVLALVLWYGWTCLFNRNLLIANPGLPYVGLILVLSALVPAGEGLVARRGGLIAKPGWAMPVWVWRTAFFALMAGYTYSGLVKLSAPSWVDGEALRMLLTNPLARDTPLRGLLLGLPAPLLKGLSWGALAGEILALPLCLAARGRAIAWTWMLLMHLGIVLVVDFADLTMGMIVAHLFVFDPAWLAGAGSRVRGTVFFDGVCVLCNESMRFLVDEDHARVLRFAPLQGETARGEPGVRELLERDGEELKSVIYVRRYLGRDGERKEVLTRSDGVLRILSDLGGFWRVLSWARFAPRFLRDPLYELVARYRYRWFGRLEACRLPRPGEAELFLD